MMVALMFLCLVLKTSIQTTAVSSFFYYGGRLDVVCSKTALRKN